MPSPEESRQLGSAWVTLEGSTILFRAPMNSGRRFVPLLLPDCELPDTLQRRYERYAQRNDTGCYPCITRRGLEGLSEDAMSDFYKEFWSRRPDLNG